ncbi:MAG: MarR family transcriptional regulator [Clostridia bacterium]|nr:MarR family transcriptional regulator [Clostridia bacterium]
MEKQKSEKIENVKVDKVEQTFCDYDLLLLKNQLCFPTYAAANKIIRRYQPLLKDLGLTYTQYIVMMVMWEKESVNEKDLVKCLYLQANTLAPLLKKLKEKGYVSIVKDESDKRNIVISLTEQGRKLRDKAVNVPKTLAEEPWFTVEEAILYKKLIYKILNDGKEN